MLVDDVEERSEEWRRQSCLEEGFQVLGDGCRGI